MTTKYKISTLESRFERAWSLFSTPSATSLQASEHGATRFDSRDGLTICPSGQPASLVNLSASQAKDAGLLTSATFGRRSSGSSASADLASSLANKLAARTVSLGSTLYQVTWKRRVTPQQRSIYALRASVRRTSGNDCIGWPTPLAMNRRVVSLDSAQRELTRRNGSAPLWVQVVAELAGWPTPVVIDGQGSGRKPRLKKDGYRDLAQEGSWRSDLKDAPFLIGETPEQWQQRDSGKPPTGLTVGQVKNAQLNPEHARWLMGLPLKVWDEAGRVAFDRLYSKATGTRLSRP
jgi:hypothetical protein